MSRIIGIGTAVPPHIYDQKQAFALALEHFRGHIPHIERMASVFDHAAIAQRHAVVPESWWRIASHGMQERNAIYLREATALGQQALERALSAAGLSPDVVDNLIVVSSTGIATPSLDARLMNTLHMRPDVRRLPIWGLGCAGGVAGLARAAEMARAYPESITALVTVETCSLTFQFQDTSKKSFISTALFADGAAAAVVAGAARADAGPAIIGSHSTLWPDSLHVMGWDVVDTGLEVVFSVEIPRYVADLLPSEVCALLNRFGLRVDQIAHMVLHPGGVKVLEAYSTALGIPCERLRSSYDVLRQYGNMSSVTVLFVLDAVMKRDNPQPGDYALAAALGPGFSAEQVLLRF